MDRAGVSLPVRPSAIWPRRSLPVWQRRRLQAGVQIVSSKNAADALPLYRHSTAHLLAAAVTNMFPGVQCGIGPPTDEGFFYDFVVPRPFVPDDLAVSYTHLRAHETPEHLVCRLLLE